MNILLDAAFKSTFILLAAWIACIALRNRSADLRHRIWLAAIFATALMPVAMRFAPSMPAIQITAAAVPATTAPVQVVKAFPWTFAIWAFGAVLMLARFMLGIARIAWITKKATLRGGIYYTDRVSTPLTWGFSTIVLREWNEIAIRHEQAHIDRHDWIWQTFASIVTAVFWFNPLVWFASAELRREAELAVDNRVLNSGADPSEYAAQLVAIARTLIQAPATSVAMVRKSALERRVRAILDSTRPRFETATWTRSVIAITAIAVVLPLAAFQDRAVHKVNEPGVRPPSLLSKIEPQYTAEAREAKIEGTVALSVVVNEEGMAENIEVVRSLDSGLDTQAALAISQWRFNPATKDGKPVPVQAMIEVNFRLQ